MKLANASYTLYHRARSADGSETLEELGSGLGWLEDEVQWRIVEGELKVVANGILYVWEDPPEGADAVAINGKRWEIVRISRFQDHLNRFHHAEVWVR